MTEAVAIALIAAAGPLLLGIAAILGRVRDLTKKKAAREVEAKANDHIYDALQRVFVHQDVLYDKISEIEARQKYNTERVDRFLEEGSQSDGTAEER